MRLLAVLKWVGLVAAVAVLATAGYFTRDWWLPWLHHGSPAEVAETASEPVAPAVKIIVGDPAQKNLGLTAEGRTARSLKAGTFTRTIDLPGMVVDRPGVSDRGLVAPVTAVVSAIHHVAGDTVRPGEALFTLRLLSESLHLTQTDLFKAAQDVKLAQAQRRRLAAGSAVIPEARVIEVDNQIARLEVAMRAYRQELVNRGLSPGDIDGVAEGRFVSEVSVVAPPQTSGHKPLMVALATKSVPVANPSPVPAYELQELKVELGQQVQAGQTLCLLANHQALAIEGRAFRDELPLLERSFQEGWPVEVDFQQDAADWGTGQENFAIRSIANNVDPVHRTFAFLLFLENQSHAVERDGRTHMLWRFRPGQKVRLRVRVEEVPNVFVLPADAVVRDGAEAFVFAQNVNTFERKGVHVLFQERGQVILANDGSLPTYTRDKEVWTIPAVARTAAAQLNRQARAGSSSIPKGYHIHADGSLHKNEDEGK